MSYRVVYSRQVRADLRDIYRFIEDREGNEIADRTLAGLEACTQGLDRFPLRGHRVPEILLMGHDYHEVHCGPYRIIYQVDGKDVRVLLAADGRRDIRSLLAKRILR